SAKVAAAAHAAAREMPLLLLLDDLHAADDDTLRMTAYLARALVDAPVALVAGARPDERLAAIARASDPLQLGPLDRAAAEQLIDQHAPGALADEARRAIHEVAEGNPLVLRELARAAGAGRLPREVRVAVVQRLAPLDPPTRRLVDLAAVLGRRFDVAALARLAQRTEEEVVATLDPLRRLGVVDGSGPSWSFSHQVVRDVVHDALAEDVRLAAHRDAAAVLAGSNAVVAGHLLAAVPAVPAAEAVAAARVAAAEAGAIGAHGERAALLARALQLVVDEDARLDLLLELGAARTSAGAVGGAVSAYDDGCPDR
ncbi:MAG: hypothetical protein LC789_06920, partial [Actinobacteria bacterium]|nr:hypothetical protein [Actinomycetota bacterium]